MKLTYEDCVELKDVGFPQGNERFINKDNDIVDIENWSEEYTYFPILEELIEACGDSIKEINLEEDTKVAVGWNGKKILYGKGKFTEQAVKNLYVALNKKDCCMTCREGSNHTEITCETCPCHRIALNKKQHDKTL